MATGYFTTLDLNPYLVDKDTGAPLSGGYVQFWQDANRTVPKVVFEKQNIGADPVTGQPIYQFVPIIDPLIVSGVGTLQNANGANVAVYYYPFDENGNIQLYYIAVFNYLGVEQFTREGWGFNSSNGGDSGNGEIIGDNMISNPQFAVVNFIPTGLTVAFTGSGTLNIPIAPDWNLQVIYAGAGNIAIQRNSIQGIQNFATNPPYVLQITPGANISSLILMQQLPHNPGIWTPQDAGVEGYVATAILLGPGTSVTAEYAPNVGAPTQLSPVSPAAPWSNTGTTYVEYTNTVQLTPSANTSNGDTGYVNINFQLSTTTVSLLSSVQIVGLDSNITGVAFNQDTVNRQVDHLFNYYNPLLQYKPIQSWLVGWDFPLNPAQFLGDSAVGPFATGVSTSSYYWDQTILFQSATSGLQVTRYLDGSMVIQAQVDTQLAMIQYLDDPTATDMIDDYISCNLNATTNQTGGIPATISLWYTSGTLPAMSANASIVATLNPDGSVATTHGTGGNAWTQVARSNLGNASFTVGLTGARQNYGFANWLDTTNAADNTTYVAVVVGFGTLRSGQTITIGSMSAVPGQIPTIPAPQTPTEVLKNCERYYEMSFNQGLVPASALGQNTGEYYFAQNKVAGGTNNMLLATMQTVKRTAPTLIIYNPVNANNQAYNTDTGTDFSATHSTGSNIGEKFFVTGATAPSGSTIGNNCCFHWTADARLGLV